MANYGRELRIEANIRKKEKIEKSTQFAERMKKSTRESCGGIKKSRREDKVICRQKKKIS